jgi:hypothetical protein
MNTPLAHVPSGWLPPDVHAPHGDFSLLPRLLARTSIFAARTGRGRGGRIVYTKATPLPALGDTDNTYQIVQNSGAQLTQVHLDIWLYLVRLSYRCKLGPKGTAVTVAFGARELLAAIGRKTVGGKDVLWLRERLTEMCSAMYTFPNLGGKKVTTGLVHEVVTERNAEGRYDVLLNSQLRELFANGWNRIELKQRGALAGTTNVHMLAQWLHTFYSTHARPLPLKGETLQILSGRDDAPKEFRSLLKEALGLISVIVPWTCKYTGEAGALVYVFRRDTVVSAASTSATTANSATAVSASSPGAKATTDAPVQEYVPPAPITALPADDQHLLREYLTRGKSLYMLYELRDHGVQLPKLHSRDDDVRRAMQSWLEHHPDRLERKIASLRRKAERQAGRSK